MYHLNAYILEFTLNKCLDVILSLIYLTQHIRDKSIHMLVGMLKIMIFLVTQQTQILNKLGSFIMYSFHQKEKTF